MNLTSNDIIKLLETNDKAVGRALVVLNERQTADEQTSESTKHHNGRGFRPCHARMGTSMAKFFEARGYLTAKQVAYWRQQGKEGMRIGIYHKQLLEAAQLKAAAKAAAAMLAQAAVEADDQVIEEFAQDVMWKNEFARQEAPAEQRAYSAKMERDIA